VPDIMTFRARRPHSDDYANLDAATHDGDTIWLEIDMGRGIRALDDIRLSKTGAPEVQPMQIGGGPTRQFAVDWLTTWSIGLWPFWVHSYRTSTYRDVLTFERYVCDVYNRDHTSCLNIEVQKFVDDHDYPHGN
jgi:hypothetical protein